jgi:predicted ATPase/DNA-binding SARP family transcriptional activator
MEQMSNLPLALPPLIGREQELHSGLSLLARSRLVTLTGPGGCGKTALALRLASVVRSASSDGVWVVELALLSDPTAMPDAARGVLQAGGFFAEEADTLMSQEWVIAALRRRDALLLLDNCEHVIAASADFVEAVLRGCPRVRILATSREALRLQEEVEWLIPPLDLPPPELPAASNASAVARLRSYAAVELFVDRARATVSSFDLTADNATLIARICHRLDGLPLALELAARYVKALSLQQIEEGIVRDMGFLAGGRRTAEARHQTLHATIEWSYRLLSRDEQLAFRQLCALAGDFGAQLAEAVCDVPHARMIASLSSLADASLVQVTRHEDEARYRILETIRQFGRSQLIEKGEEEATYERYCRWAERYTAAISDARGDDPKLSLECLDREHDHVRAVLRWMQSQRETTRALRLAIRLLPFWRQRGYVAEGRRWLEGLLAQRDTAEPLIFADACNDAGVLAMWQGDYQCARVWHETALAILRRSDRGASSGLLTALTAMTQFRLGFLAEKYGDYASAERHLEQSLLMYSAIDDVAGKHMARSRLALVYHHRGERRRAETCLEDSLAFYRGFGEHGPVAALLLNLGTMALERGRLQRAATLLEESLRLNERIGDRFAALFSLTYLGVVSLRQNDLTRSEQRFCQALGLARADSNPEILVRLLDGVAMVAAQRDDLAQAACLWGSMIALRTAKRIEYRRAEKRSHERALAAARVRAEASVFHAAWQEGATLSLEAILARASAPFYSGAAVATRDQLPAEEALPEPAPDLRIKALGSARVWRGARELVSADFVYAKARELLFFLLSSPPRTKEQICLALWPDADPTHAHLNFRVTLYHLRRALGRRDWVNYSQNLYSLNRSRQDALQYDVDTFECRVDEAERHRLLHPDRACALLEEAISLYEGEYLQSVRVTEWATPLQDALRRRHQSALLSLASLYLERGEARRALTTFQCLIAQDKYAEEAHRGVIQCYVKLQDMGRAAGHYQYLCAVLKEELGISPAPQTRAAVQQAQTSDTTSS